MSLKRTILFALLILSIIQGKALAQCGTEPITVTDWCENTYAKWQFDNPTPGAVYTWYKAGNYGPSDLDADGQIPSAVKYGSTTDPFFYSPFRVRQADVPATGIQFTYVKSVNYTKAVPYPATNPAFTTGPSGGTYSMTYSSTVPVRLNSIKVPVVLYTPGKQYKIQIAINSPTGTGSAVYTFTPEQATNIGGQNYLVTIPVNLTIPAGGTIVLNSNPTGGTGAPVDQLLYAPNAYGGSTTGPLTFGTNAPYHPTGSYPTGYTMLYDWDFTVVCPPQTTLPAKLKTSGCCVLPASINFLSLNSDKSSITNGGSVYANLTVGSGDPANYFAWYLNGALQSAPISGIGKMSHSTNIVGTWEVREVKDPADLGNPSCYANAKFTLLERKVFATIVTSPGHTPLCLGDQWTLSGKGSSNLTWSSGKGKLNPTTGPTTTYTATDLGSDIITLTGDVITGDLIVNGDFENAAQAQTIKSGLPYANNPTQADGTYSVATDALKNGAWGNTDWTYGGTRPTAKGNPDNFMIINNPVSTTPTLIWGQDVTVAPGSTYTFSFDFTSVSYIVSKDVEGYSGTPKAPYKDVILDVYINGSLIGTASTDFGANSGLDAVGKWKNFQFPWTAGTSTAKIEIRQRATSDPRGYDYGLDNIAFGGLVQQTDEVTVGPITDCSTLTATASSCIDDSLSELKATMTGGLVFDHWENASGVVVGTTNPLRVKTPVAATYTAVAYMVSGNVLDNGNFESGNVGFISGTANGYFNNVASMAGGGNNEFIISNGTSPGTNAGNSFWSNLTPPVGGSRMLSADAKGPVGAKIIGWTFPATAGDKFAFSGWVANQHTTFTQTNPDTNSSGRPATVGVYINNVLIAVGATGANQNWVKMAANWTAPSTGTFTLDVRDLKGTNGPGNDFVLDDFSLSPATGIVKKATAQTPVCDPCANKPTIVEHTYCGNAGYVSLTPNPLDPAGVIYSWYDKVTNPSKLLGTTVGTQKDTLDLTGIIADPLTGEKTVYYTKSAKGSGTVFKRTQSCDTGFDDNWTDVNGTNASYQSQFTTTKPVKITELSFNLNSDIQAGNTKSATISFAVVGAMPAGNGNGKMADLTKVYGTFSTNWSRTGGTPQTKTEIIKLTGSTATLPVGDFFIVQTQNTSTGNGQLRIGRSDCNQGVVWDDLDGTTVSRSGGAEYNSGNLSRSGLVFDVKFEVPAAICPRTPVKLTEDCPCSPPKTVVVNAGFDTDTTLCKGSNLNIIGTYTLDPATPPQKGYMYTWYRKTAAGVIVNVDGPKALVPSPITLHLTNLDSAANYGTYYLKIEDGDGITSNKSCYLQDSLLVRVNKPNTAATLTASQILCSGSKPADFTGSAGAGGSGTAKYQWRVTPANLSGGADFKNITGANGKDYTFPGVADTAFYNKGTTNKVYSYHRRDSSGVCPAVISNVVTITVLPEVKPGTISADQVICKGTVPAALTQTPATGGGTTYTYQWQSSTNPATVPFTNVSGGTGAATSLYTPPALTDSIYYRRSVVATIGAVSCPAVYSDTIKISMVPDLKAPVISTDQKICYNTQPANLTISTAPKGGLKAGDTYTYKWESKADGASSVWTNTGVTTAGYAFAGPLTDTMSYDLIVTGSCGNITSNAVTITVLPELKGGTIAGGATICSGQDPADITNTQFANGANGTSDYTYTWQQAVNSGAFGAIANTGATYAVPVLPANTGTTSVTYSYKRIVTSTYCPTPTAESNVVTYTVTPEVKAGSIGTGQTVCSGNPIAALTELTATSGGDGNYTYKWQSSTTGTAPWSDATPAGATNNYTPDPQGTTIYFSRLDNATGCQAVRTNVVKIEVLAGITAGSIGSNQEICSGATPAVIKTVTQPTNTTSSAVISWEYMVPPNTAIWNPAPNSQNQDTYQFPNTLNGGLIYIKKVVKDSGVPGQCNTAETGSVSIKFAAPLDAGFTGTDETICEGKTPSLLTETTAPSGGKSPYSYNWQLFDGTSWIDAPGAHTNSSYAPPALSNTTTFRRTVNDVLNCGPKTNDVVVITVTQNVNPSVTIDNPGQKCIGSSLTFNATPVNGGTTPIYAWTVDGVAAGTNSPTFTSSALADGAVIKVKLTSSEKCITPGQENVFSNEEKAQLLSNITPQISIVAPAKICQGTPVTFIPSYNTAPSVYEWYLNGTLVDNAPTYSGTFNNGDQIYVKMTSPLTCVTTPTGTSGTVKMNVVPIPTPDINEPDTTICSGISVVYTATVGTGTALTWYRNGQPVNTNSTGLVVFESGLYTLQEDNGVCPRFSDTIEVNVIPTPVANAGHDIYVLEGTAVTLNGSGGDVYSWTPVDGLSSSSVSNPVFTASENTLYTLTVSDATGRCWSKDEVNVFVERPISIPNAFTPNKDGNNETWEIANIEGFPNVTFEVYNRWGTLVWKSTGNLKMWDGTNYRNGEVLPDGTYFYVIDLHSVIFKDPYSGYVQILK